MLDWRALLACALLAGSASADSLDVARQTAVRAGADSVAVSLAIVERWIRQAPKVLPAPPRTAPESATWSERELLDRLSAPELEDRALAIDEAGRRGSAAALAVLRRRLETGIGAGKEEIGLLEATSMIEALGQARDSAAVPELMEYAAMEGPYVRAYIDHALGQIGDSRALSLLRPGLLGPCGWAGGVSPLEANIRAIANLGDASDLGLLANVARTCAVSRRSALAAIGAIAGTEAAIDTMVTVLELKPGVNEVLSLSDVGTRIQAMAAERRAIRRDPG